jgi:hypothetical protein
VVLGKGDCIVSDLSNKSPSELRAEIEALQAALAAMEAEPDYEAWRPALSAFYKGCGRTGQPPDVLARVYKEHIDGLIAALPLAPAGPVDEAWIERTAREITQNGDLWATPRDLAILAIRATLNRGARWPGDDELREMAARVSGEAEDGAWTSDVCLEMARCLRAHMTGDPA